MSEVTREVFSIRMQSIKDLLNQIKWDKKEHPADYTIGYEDRVAKGMITIKYTDIKRMEGNFMVIEKDLKETEIPLHRVREVKKKGELVWERHPHTS